MTDDNYEEMLGEVVKTAMSAGTLLLDMLGNKRQISYKGDFNLVTEADLKSESLILERLHSLFPGHRVLSEEAGESEDKSRYLWLVDPLDGTTNYAHRFPVFAVSIALAVDGALQLGVVYDPSRDELFTAVRGGGAHLNGRRLEISKKKQLRDSLLATGFPYTIRKKPGRYFKYFEIYYLRCHGVRRCGAAALDLSYVASGRLDGFWEAGLKPWDMAAGVLLIEEAGGISTNFAGGELDLFFPEIVTANSYVHQEMLAVISEVDRA